MNNNPFDNSSDKQHVKTENSPIFLTPANEEFGKDQRAEPSVGRDPYAAENRKIQMVLLGIIGACGMVFCILSLLIVPGILRRTNIPALANTFPTWTPTPNMTATQQAMNLAATADGFQTTASNAARQWKVILSDTFDTNENEWPTGTNDDEYLKTTSVLKDGKYVWDVLALQGFVDWIYPAHDRSIKNFLVTVECKAISTDPAAYGIIFRKGGANNYYYFELNNFGQFSFYLMYKNEWKTIIARTSSPFINIAESNRITILGEGAHFTFLINDKYVADAVDDTVGFGSIYMAYSLNVNNQAIFEFDNFEIRAP